MSAYSARNGIAGIAMVLLILTLFGAYVALSSGNGATISTSEDKILAQGSCNSPFPSPPANTHTLLKNGTVETSNWLPVLLMSGNATGQICIKYTNNLNDLFQSQVNGGVYKPSIIKQGNSISITASPTSVPSISASPSNIYLYLGSSQIVTYTIESGSNTSGIFSVGTLQSCPGTPLAVGYQESDLNVSDFSYFLGTFYGCYVDLSSTMVGVTNIQVAYLPIHSNYTLYYNILNSSVVSVNPSPKVQNLTFNLEVQAYGSPITVSLDSGDPSSLVAMPQDPNLSKLPSNQSCTWYPNNHQSFEAPPGSPESPVWTALESSGSGTVTVHAPIVAIPAYSVFNYSLSIQLSNLSKSYYYALSLSLNITASARNYSTLQGFAAYYPVNIGRSDFGGSASQLLSGSC